MANNKDVYEFTEPTPFNEKSMVTLHLPKWQVKQLKKLHNQSRFVEGLISKFSGWKPPKRKKRK